MLLALGLRVYVAETAAVEWDEDDYLSPARVYREYMNDGDWSRIPDVAQNREHPPLVKLVYATVLDADELDAIPLETFRSQKSYLPPNSLRNTRWLSVLFGTLTVLILASIRPAMGLALAFLPLHVHFSSVAYLEALPVLLVAGSAWMYLRYQGAELPRKRIYFVVSALGFGAAVACKYPYSVVGVALLAHALVNRHMKLAQAVLWGAIAVAFFFMLNPTLWPNPIGRLDYQLNYHQDYAENVAGYHSVFNPYEQLTAPNDFLPREVRHPLWRSLALAYFVTFLVGLVILLRGRNYFGWWLALGLLFLMLWPTQWIQHKMLVAVPYSVAVAVAAEYGVNRLRQATYS